MERCLILDFDDTLVSTIDTHANSWKLAIERVLNRDIPIETIMSDINYGMDVLLKKYQLTEKESKLAQDYKRKIFSKNLHKTKINQLLLWVIKNSNFEELILNFIFSTLSAANSKTAPEIDVIAIIFNENKFTSNIFMIKPKISAGNIEKAINL